MSNCSMCGAPVPDSQKVCSMCYGDPGYGTDGYYEEYLQEQERQYEGSYEEYVDNYPGDEE